jgi:hypothetical protein
MPKPTPQRPWQEAILEVGGRAVVVALIWNRPVMRTDLFLDGASQLDARMIEEARLAAPAPMSDYEVWVEGLYGHQGPPQRSLVSPRMRVVALVAIVVLVPVFALDPRPSGVVAGSVAAIALVSLFVIWFRSWFVVGDRIHAYLLARPGFGDAGRKIRFFAAFGGYALGSFVIFLVTLLVLGS